MKRTMNAQPKTAAKLQDKIAQAQGYKDHADAIAKLQGARYTGDVTELIPEGHTAAIVTGDTVYFSGNMEACRDKWDTLPFDAPGGSYQFIANTIMNKWYRMSWITFS